MTVGSIGLIWPLNFSGSYMYYTTYFNSLQVAFCISQICMILTVNSDYFPKQR
jgi:hypothetical protein